MQITPTPIEFTVSITATSLECILLIVSMLTCITKAARTTISTIIIGTHRLRLARSIRPIIGTTIRTILIGKIRGTVRGTVLATWIGAGVGIRGHIIMATIIHTVITRTVPIRTTIIRTHIPIPIRLTTIVLIMAILRIVVINPLAQRAKTIGVQAIRVAITKVRRRGAIVRHKQQLPPEQVRVTVAPLPTVPLVVPLPLTDLRRAAIVAQEVRIRHRAAEVAAAVAQAVVTEIAVDKFLLKISQKNRIEMKKIVFSLLFGFFAVAMSAQGIFDINRYTETPNNGSARYMGMAGAFGALGGDMSAVADNPAAAGIFRSSEIQLTGKLNVPVSQGSWGTNSLRSKGDYKFDWLSNASFVLVQKHEEREFGLLSSNFGFSFNRLKSFRRTLSFAGAATESSMTDYMVGITNGFGLSDLKYTTIPAYDPFNNDQIPWISVLGYEAALIKNDSTSTNWTSLLNVGETVNPSYFARESGYLDEYAFTYGANINDVAYIGAALSMQVLDYSVDAYYKEKFANKGEFTLTNILTTKGLGVNFKLGAIVRATDFLRLGVSVHTPTFFANVTDRFSGRIDYDTDTIDYIKTPSGKSTYRYISPFKFQASAAFIIGKRGIVSLDYMLTAYNKMRLLSSASDKTLDIEMFGGENGDIANYSRISHTAKIGGEFRASDQFSLRAGFAFSTPSLAENTPKIVPMNTVRTDMEYVNDRGSMYGSFGLGYRFQNGFSIDFAYVYRQKRELFRPFDSTAEAAKIKTHYNVGVFTLAYRF